MPIEFCPLREPWPGSYSDPAVVRDPNRSPEFVLTIADLTNGEHVLYESSDLRSFTEIDRNITPYTISGGTSIGDVLLVDGTYIVYVSINDDHINVLTGPDMSSLSESATNIVDKGDGGAIYRNGTFWLATEGTKVTNEPTSNTLELWEADTYDGSYSHHSTLIDVSGKNWHTGDPEFLERDGQVEMWIDRSTDHPNYYQAYCVGDTVPGLSLADDKVTYQYGGDFSLINTDRGAIAFSEFTGSDTTGVGIWEESSMTSNGHQVPISARGHIV